MSWREITISCRFALIIGACRLLKEEILTILFHQLKDTSPLYIGLQNIEVPFGLEYFSLLGSNA
jgi:hypothetical protein